VQLLLLLETFASSCSISTFCSASFALSSFFSSFFSLGTKRSPLPGEARRFFSGFFSGVASGTTRSHHRSPLIRTFTPSAGPGAGSISSSSIGSTSSPDSAIIGGGDGGQGPSGTSLPKWHQPRRASASRQSSPPSCPSP
jgi:hypothetical protein